MTDHYGTQEKNPHITDLSPVLVCKLDQQQCQQECEHKSDRKACPFVEMVYKVPNKIEKK